MICCKCVTIVTLNAILNLGGIKVNKVYEFIINEYGYDEPVFSVDLKERLDMSEVTIRQNLKRLTEKGALLRVENGIYYVPRRNSVLGPRVNFDKVVTRKYIKPNECDVIGFNAGINFANQLGITTQTASVTTIVTNRVKRNKRQEIGKKHVIVKCSKVQITPKNYKVLQVLDLLDDFNRISEIPLESATNIFKKYLSDVKIPKGEFLNYIKEFSQESIGRLLEMELFNEITRK